MSDAICQMVSKASATTDSVEQVNLACAAFEAAPIHTAIAMTVAASSTTNPFFFIPSLYIPLTLMSNAKPRGSRTAGGLRHEETPDLRRGPCSHPVSDQHYRPKDGADAKDLEDPHKASPLSTSILVEGQGVVKSLLSTTVIL